VSRGGRGAMLRGLLRGQGARDEQSGEELGGEGHVNNRGLLRSCVDGASDGTLGLRLAATLVLDTSSLPRLLPQSLPAACPGSVRMVRLTAASARSSLRPRRRARTRNKLMHKHSSRAVLWECSSVMFS
jgi:hypothetical protein